MSWIKNEFEGLEMGDQRLNARFLETAAQLFLSPDETIDKSLEELPDKKAANRLFSNKSSAPTTGKSSTCNADRGNYFCF